MSHDERAYLQANAAEVRRIIEILSDNDLVGRLGMTEHLKDIEEQIAALESADRVECRLSASEACCYCNGRQHGDGSCCVHPVCACGRRWYRSEWSEKECDECRAKKQAPEVTG